MFLMFFFGPFRGLFYTYIRPSIKRGVRKEIKLNEYWCLLAAWWKSSCNYHFISGLGIICELQLAMLSISPIIPDKDYIPLLTSSLSKCIATCSVQLAVAIHDFF